jgi:hypothetical protein
MHTRDKIGVVSDGPNYHPLAPVAILIRMLHDIENVAALDMKDHILKRYSTLNL